MKTFIFYGKYADATIIISAENDEQAFEELSKSTFEPQSFRLAEVVEE